LNTQATMPGAGINIAQRVMDCGDAGHILLSKHVADDLEHYAQWRPLLHELGECEVKHGVTVSIVNLFNDEVGNAALPAKFPAPSRTAAVVAKEPRSQSRRSILIAALLIIIGAIIGIYFFLRSLPKAQTVSSSPPSEFS